MGRSWTTPVNLTDDEIDLITELFDAAESSEQPHNFLSGELRQMRTTVNRIYVEEDERELLLEAIGYLEDMSDAALQPNERPSVEWSVKQKLKEART